MDWLIENWSSILQIIGGIIAVASVVVKLTPSATDNIFLKKLISLLELLALTPKERKK